VLSAYDSENFGDRLGYYNINTILPERAVVTHASFYLWNLPEPEEIDILILGIGNSMFELFLDERLLKLVEKVPYTVGIFGTQYRKAINKRRLKKLIGKLALWYARNERDIELYGSYNSNAFHLGDWLINLVPVTTPVLREELNISNYIKNISPKNRPIEHIALDRIIQTIQQYESVYTPRVHFMLCALTSANRIAYTEQRDFGYNEISGKFNSLLFDVFGQEFPENEFFDIDKKKVIDYKVKVRKNVQELKLKIEQIVNHCVLPPA
jgi:hypothetical protein